MGSIRCVAWADYLCALEYPVGRLGDNAFLEVMVYVSEGVVCRGGLDEGRSEDALGRLEEPTALSRAAAREWVIGRGCQSLRRGRESGLEMILMA
uniref:Uncharacterized protein n=1 Tax=Knipowitschia caucasica TaxID=637954 RepID=A0AAV2L607_KNICA